jgi:hypothetical protein
MSDIETSNWSETAASNNAAPPNGMPEGMAPSGVNDSGREIMAAIKREWDRSHPTVTSGGSANAQTLSYGVNPTALVQGQVYSFIAGFTNTGAATLQVGSLAAKTLKLDGQGFLGGEIVVGNLITVFYDGSAYQIVSSRPISTIPAKNILINPDFDIWQRGAGDSAIINFAASSSTYGPDRWYVGSGANEAGTVSVSGIVVNGSRHSALIQRLRKASSAMSGHLSAPPAPWITWLSSSASSSSATRPQRLWLFSLLMSWRGASGITGRASPIKSRRRRTSGSSAVI